VIAYGTHKQSSGIGRDSCPVLSCESRNQNGILYQPLVMRIVTMNGSRIPKYFCTKSMKQTHYSEITPDRQRISIFGIELCINSRTSTSIFMYVYTYIYIYIHEYRYTYIYTHTHIYMYIKPAHIYACLLRLKRGR
jgi:hypothetical protein